MDCIATWSLSICKLYYTYPTKSSIKKSSDFEALVLYFHSSIANGTVLSKIFNKQDEFNFDIVNFTCLDIDITLAPLYGVYISYPNCFARLSSHVNVLNNRISHVCLLSEASCRYQIRKAFSMVYRRQSKLAAKYIISLMSILQCIWAPSSEFVSSSIPSWQILTAHAQPFRGARDLAFCLKVPLDSMLVWASSGGSGETARMRRLAWTFAARIGDKYQIRWNPSFMVAAYKLENYGKRQQSKR